MSVAITTIKKTTWRILSYLLLAAGGATMVIPFLWMISTSLKRLIDVFVFPPQWIPRPIMWRNYAQVFKLVPFDRFYANSLIVSVSVTLGVLLTSSLAAFAFARLDFPGRDLLFALYLGTLMIPGQVVIIPRFIIIKYLHWTDTYAALIVPGLFSAYGTFMMRQFFLTLPHALHDAAVIDGCNPFGVYWRIFLPLAKPGLATLGIFTFMNSWNDFLWPLVVTSRVSMRTIPVGLAYFQTQVGTDWHYMMAGATMATVPILIIFSLAQKYFVQGIALTGIKS